MASKRGVLIETYKAKSAPYHYQHVDNRMPAYFESSKERAMLGLSFQVGCLNLRAHRKSESMKKFGTFQCLIPACTGNDSLAHIMDECQGYKVSQYKDKGIFEELIDYLYRVNKIRTERFSTSMINWKSGK